MGWIMQPKNDLALKNDVLFYVIQNKNWNAPLGSGYGEQILTVKLHFSIKRFICNI